MKVIITDNTVTYETSSDSLDKIGVNVGDVYDAIDYDGYTWIIKVKNYKIPVSIKEAEFYIERDVY